MHASSPMTTMKLLIPFTLALLTALATPAWAQFSRDAAAATARQAGGGRVLSVDRSEYNGRAVWRVKVVTPKGEVRVLLLDATTGQAL
ncbi:PepSY domain-containing protein [Rhodoferax sp. PAMC 29310]|uniref:PepSY domain-containing protein n=1 Tax=Rhodoferax sp. PAMC 29310 TaxID=2822760 RepID=UPI001F0B3D57|nr:PepSY domain-containing protein [Rhodoferax sp. PAMC 29310]